LASLVEAGITFVNSHARTALGERHMPFGGVKQSGIGRVRTTVGLAEYIEYHAISLNKKTCRAYRDPSATEDVRNSLKVLTLQKADAIRVRPEMPGCDSFYSITSSLERIQHRSIVLELRSIVWRLGAEVGFKRFHAYLANDIFSVYFRRECNRFAQ
jgi:hypothetical protein